MSDKYVISTPSAPIRLTPDQDSELADEAVYGMTLEVIRSENNWAYVRMEYGYEGWINQSQITQDKKDQWAENRNALIQSPFADLMPEATYKGYPKMTIPRGSVIRLLSEIPENEGWITVETLDRIRLYARKEWLRPFSEFPDKDDSEALRSRVVKDALSYIGTSYRWGGKTPAGIDCSGLTFMSHWMNGVHIYRDAVIKPGYLVKEISEEQLECGDLLYFPGHIALYMGEGAYVHSTGSQGGVVLNSLEPGADRYHEELRRTMYACGSIHSQQ